VLSTRLRELEAGGLITRGRVPAPTPATLYELTADGRDLRPVIDALARWGARRLTRPAPGEAVEPRWFARFLAANVAGQALADGSTFELRVDDETFALAVRGGEVVATTGPADAPTATLSGALNDFFLACRGDRGALGRIRVRGDHAAARRLLALVPRTDGSGRPGADA
jgi:hypothetical protein